MPSFEAPSPKNETLAWSVPRSCVAFADHVAPESSEATYSSSPLRSQTSATRASANASRGDPTAVVVGLRRESVLQVTPPSVVRAV